MRPLLSRNKTLLAILLIAALGASAMPISAEEVAADETGECSATANGRNKVFVSSAAFHDEQTGDEGITLAFAGERVNWYFMSGTHRVYHGDPSVPALPNAFDSGIQNSNGAEPPCWEHRFDIAGYYPYYCKVHYSMRGMIVVI